MLYNKNGFTLIEVLIILSILGIMLFLVTPLTYQSLESQREKQFINDFSSDMLLMQSYSRTTSSEVRFWYYKGENKYKIYKGGGKPVVERDIPIGWEIRMRTQNYIQFSNSGSISKLGSIVLKTKNHTYKFIFSLGKGRFRIEKS